MKITGKEFFKQLQIVWGFMAVSQVAFLLFFYFQTEEDLVQSKSFPTALFSIFSTVLPLIIILGFYVAKRSIKNGVKENTLSGKLLLMKKGKIMHFALAEGVSFFAIILYSYTTDIIFLACAGFCVAFFVTLRPSKEKLVSELQLSAKERQLIDDESNAFIEVKK